MSVDRARSFLLLLISLASTSIPSSTEIARHWAGRTRDHTQALTPRPRSRCRPQTGGCVAVMHRSQLLAPKKSEFERLTSGRWATHKSAYRQSDCPLKSGSCAGLQFAEPWGNPDLARIDYAGLVPGGDAIVLSKVRWRFNVADRDRMYLAGTNLEAGRRLTYLVAYSDEGDTYGSTADGQQIARYKLFSATGTAGDDLHEVSSGYIVACAVPHPAGTNGGFIGCLHAHQLRAIDSTYHVAFKALLNARHCDSDMITATRADSIQAQCAAQRRSKLMALKANVSGGSNRQDAFVSEVIKAWGDESLDPYWFSCPAGCCTAATTR